MLTGTLQTIYSYVGGHITFLLDVAGSKKIMKAQRLTISNMDILTEFGVGV